jgi:hypothetical protein
VSTGLITPSLAPHASLDAWPNGRQATGLAAPTGVPHGRRDNPYASVRIGDEHYTGPTTARLCN